MSYQQMNPMYSNANTRTQQMAMMNSVRGSSNSSVPPSQSLMANQYQSYPSPSHQTVPPYEAYGSRSNNYYASNPGAYEYSQTAQGRTSYGENYMESSSYMPKNSNLSSTMNDLNVQPKVNDHPNANMAMPIRQSSQGSFGYNNAPSMPTGYPLGKPQQQAYFNHSQLQQQQQSDDAYDISVAAQYTSVNSSMPNPRFTTPNTGMYRLPYQNEIHSTSGQAMPYAQQSRYPSHLNGVSNYQTTWPPNNMTSAGNSDSNYAYSYNNQSQMSAPPTAIESHISSDQDNDNNSSKPKPSQSSVSKSPSCTSISSYVPDDVDSSNSSFSDSPSISNEKHTQKRKISQATSVEVFNKLREMGDEQERNLFVDRLQKLWEELSFVCRKLPCISRQTIDLYRLYVYIREQNGFEQFSKIAKNRHWRDIALKLNIPNCSTAAFHIKQKYINLKLFHYECKYDRGGIDPERLLVELDKPQEKQSKKATKITKEPPLSASSQAMPPINPATSNEKNDIENLPSQQSQMPSSIALKKSPSSNTVTMTPVSNTNNQLQQVPTLINQQPKRPAESSELNTTSIPISFPLNSIEATTISSRIKRRKLTVKDIPSFDPRKLLMSLRGGLLAETTWALDTINIMLSDDQTHVYLHLKQVPGLLQAFIDIYTKCLAQLFEEFKIENEEILNNSETKCQDEEEKDSVIYRIESNCLNKYQRKHVKQHNIIFENVYDDNGNLKHNPENVLDLKNTDDLCYIQTHFDPLHKHDNYYENLYYGHHADDTVSCDEHDQEPTKKSCLPSQKQIESETTEVDHQNSDHEIEITDSTQEFLRRYKRKFQYDEAASRMYSTDSDSFSNGNYQQDSSSTLFTRYSLAYDQICSRCISISSILRNLSFIAGNDIEMVKSETLIRLLARLLLLRHSFNHDNETNSASNNQITNDYDSKSESQNTSLSLGLSECLINIRENTLVILSNIAGVIIFDAYDSSLINQLVNGLLHWSTCFSSEALNPLQSSYISAQHLSIEILTKLSAHDINMDFILATPSFYCIIALFHILTDWLNVNGMNNSDISNSYANLTQSQAHIQREFAIVLLNALLRCDSNSAHIISHVPYTISLLINFLEDYDRKTNDLIIRYGLEYVLRLINSQENEQILFTTNDMLTRAATCLLSIVNYRDNVKIMKKYEDRILNLSISNVIDPHIGRILTDILHHCSLYNS